MHVQVKKKSDGFYARKLAGGNYTDWEGPFESYEAASASQKGKR